MKTAVWRRHQGDLPEAEAARLERVRGMAQQLLLRQKLEERLHIALNHIGARRGGPARKALADFGRKVWAILRRTRAQPKKRAYLLSEAGEKLRQERVVTDEAIRYIETVTCELFAELEQKGELDRLPSVEVTEGLLAKRAGERVMRDEQMCAEEWRKQLREYEQARERMLRQVLDEARPLFAEKGKQEEVFYIGVVRGCLYAAQRTRAGSKEREQATEEALQVVRRKGLDVELARQVAEFALRRFDELLRFLPPNPRTQL